MGCRRRAPQAELVRVARTPEGRMVVSRTAPGRGAWLCAGSSACLELALRRKGLERGLRSPLVAGAADELRASFGRPAAQVADWNAAERSPGGSSEGLTKG